jgi:uncharacterized membrane protein
VGSAVLLIAVFLACAVEAVEALTIVLAIGTTRGWRPAGQGIGAGLAVLAAVVVVAGSAVSRIPIDQLRLVVGSLLLVFGLQWLRKAVLRASRVIPLHDEDAIYRRTIDAASGATRDWYGFVVVFKGVVLEGLEVVFIVVTFGAGQHAWQGASVAAVVAIAVVTALGFAVHRPLATVPENTMKFIVGSLLTTFGVFWAGEGAGASYPWGDAFIPVILVVVVAAALGTVAALRTRQPAAVR